MGSDQIERLELWARDHQDPAVQSQAGRVRELSEACLDWARAKGVSSADWVARVRNWIRKDADRAPSGFSPQKASGSRATELYDAAFVASLRADPPPADRRSASDLSAALEQIGEERFRAALRKFFEFGERDQWIKSQGYSAREFLRQITKCDLHAQKTQGRRVLDEDAPEEPDPNWREYLGDSYGGRIGVAS